MYFFILIFRNIVFYVLFFVFSVVTIPLFSIVVCFKGIFFCNKRLTFRLIRKLICLWGFCVVKILTFTIAKIKYKDYSNLKSLEPCIFVCNHRSFSDGFLVSYPVFNYECIQIVNKWPFKMPILGIIARLAGYISIHQMDFECFLEKNINFIKQGVSIVCFPEGTRSGNNVLGDFYSAIFRVALKAKCTIVPICFSGNENIPKKGSFILNPGIIKINKLKPLLWEEYKDLTAFVLKNRVRKIILEELSKMDKLNEKL